MNPVIHIAFLLYPQPPRGLRVRMGLHSGIYDQNDIVDDRKGTRTTYSGTFVDGWAKVEISSALGDLILLWSCALCDQGYNAATISHQKVYFCGRK